MLSYFVSYAKMSVIGSYDDKTEFGNAIIEADKIDAEWIESFQEETEDRLTRRGQGDFEIKVLFILELDRSDNDERP